MRLLELKSLAEAALTAGEITTYPWRQELFINKIRNGEPFELTTGEEVTIDPAEADRLQGMLDSGTFGGTVKIALDDGTMLSLGKLQKTVEFQKEGGVKGEGVSNKGDISEGILSAALFAKLKARVNKQIGTVTPDDIWSVVDSLTKTGKNTYTVNVKDGKSMVNDSIVFTLILPPEAYRDFIDPTKRPLLKDQTDSAALFANSEDNEEFSKYFYLNGRPDIINIICDGGNPEKQKISKVDIEVVITDKLTGKVDRRRLDISLKVDAAQFGQVGVGSTKDYDFFEKQVSLWNKFGVDVRPSQEGFDEAYKKGGLVDALAYIYEFAADVIATLLADDNSEDEYMFITELAKGINYYATLGNPNIILLDFSSGGYKMMRFDDIEGKLKGIKLTASYNYDTKLPQVDIYDANTGKLFVKVRVKITAKERRNYIEKGPLMTELLGTKVKRLKK